ncbi:MAG: MFS transporter, partial [Conexibacter sp.]
ILVLGIVRTDATGWGAVQTLALIAAGLVLLIGFVGIEGRLARAPLMPLRIYRSRALTTSNLIVLLIGGATFGMWFFLSLYLQQVLGQDALHAGLSYLPLAFAIIFSAGGASQLVTKVGPKPVLVTGLLFTTVGLILFTQISPDGSYLGDVLIPSVIVAVGLGLSFVSLTITAVSGVDHDEAGLASGLLNTAQQVGGALGLAVLSSVAASQIADSGARGPAALTDGFQSAFAVGAGFAALGVVLALLVVPHVRPGELAEVPAAA